MKTWIYITPQVFETNLLGLKQVKMKVIVKKREASSFGDQCCAINQNTTKKRQNCSAQLGCKDTTIFETMFRPDYQQTCNCWFFSPFLLCMWKTKIEDIGAKNAKLSLIIFNFWHFVLVLCKMFSTLILEIVGKASNLYLSA